MLGSVICRARAVPSWIPCIGDASGELRTVLVEELGVRAWRTAGDLLEGAGCVVVSPARIAHSRVTSSSTAPSSGARLVTSFVRPVGRHLTRCGASGVHESPSYSIHHDSPDVSGGSAGVPGPRSRHRRRRVEGASPPLAGRPVGPMRSRSTGQAANGWRKAWRASRGSTQNVKLSSGLR